MKKLLFIPLLLLLVLGCKDKDEVFFINQRPGGSPFNGFPIQEFVYFSNQGGSEIIEWTSDWAEIFSIEEYPASYMTPLLGESRIYPVGFGDPDNEYRIKHPIVWKGDTLEGEWFRIIKQYDIPENLRVLYNVTRCHKNIIETQPNTTGEGRVLMLVPLAFAPAVIIQEGSSE